MKDIELSVSIRMNDGTCNGKLTLSPETSWDGVRVEMNGEYCFSISTKDLEYLASMMRSYKVNK